MRVSKTKAPYVSSGKLFFEALNNLTTQKKFTSDEVLTILQEGLLAAYKKKYKTRDNAKVVFDESKEEIYLLIRREVVDKVILEGMQIEIHEAKKINPDVTTGEFIEVKENPDSYGRVAAQSALYIINKSIKQLEQKKILEEYSSKLGELINGFVLRKRGEVVYVNLGKVEAIMPMRHQIPGERYRIDDKIKVLLHSIEEEKNGNIKIIVSRADKKFIKRLFHIEVPEIYEGLVEVKSVGRIPGIRSKVVVHSTRSEVDPVGACVGMKGIRIQAITREVGNEKIDLILYSEDIKKFISDALTPAKPVLVKADTSKQEAIVVTNDTDLSMAIGKDGSNVKIASFITGYRLDVMNETQFSEQMASPEAKQKLDALFQKDQKITEEQNKDLTHLSELPGVSKRIQSILIENDIKYIEDLIDLEEADLENIEGIGVNTSKKIMSIISENIEFEEEDNSSSDN